MSPAIPNADDEVAFRPSILFKLLVNPTKARTPYLRQGCPIFSPRPPSASNLLRPRAEWMILRPHRVGAISLILPVRTPRDSQKRSNGSLKPWGDSLCPMRFEQGRNALCELIERDPADSDSLIQSSFVFNFPAPFSTHRAIPFRELAGDTVTKNSPPDRSNVPKRHSVRITHRPIHVREMTPTTLPMLGNWTARFRA
jgi:hypothetical protein